MKVKKFLSIMLISTLIFSFSGCAGKEEEKVNEKVEQTSKLKGELNVFAAASLKISLEKIIEEYNKENPEVKIKLVTNGSDKLYNQMKEGAPCDLFISASQKWMDEAIKNGLVDEKDASPFLNNEVVLIKNKKAKDLKLKDIKDGKDLCLGAESVPVGGYSKKYFEGTGQWENLKQDASFEPQVTDVVKKVAEGARNYGLVYKTDANSEIKKGTIEVTDKIPENSGIKVIYPIGITKNTKTKEVAESFKQFLSKGKAKDILEDIGFVFVK